MSHYVTTPLSKALQQVPKDTLTSIFTTLTVSEPPLGHVIKLGLPSPSQDDVSSNINFSTQPDSSSRIVTDHLVKLPHKLLHMITNPLKPSHPGMYGKPLFVTMQNPGNLVPSSPIPYEITKLGTNIRIYQEVDHTDGSRIHLFEYSFGTSGWYFSCPYFNVPIEEIVEVIQNGFDKTIPPKLANHF